MNWCMILAGWMLLVTTGHAMTWRDWWLTQDQQAQTLWKAGEYAQAEKLFQRSDWRATAAYRAGNYQQAAQTYGALQTTEGYYNAGNALAKMGQYQPAIAAYNQALQREAQHQDALFNRQLVQKLLEKQQKSQSDKPPPQSDKQDPSQSDKQKQQQPSSPKNSDSEPSKSEQDQQKKPKDEPAESPKKFKPEPTQPPPKTDKSDKTDKAAKKQPANRSEREEQQAKEQWLRLIPDDPAYLLREKFLRDHLKRQSGWSGS